MGRAYELYSFEPYQRTEFAHGCRMLQKLTPTLSHQNCSNMMSPAPLPKGDEDRMHLIRRAPQTQPLCPTAWTCSFPNQHIVFMMKDRTNATRDAFSEHPATCELVVR